LKTKKGIEKKVDHRETPTAAPRTKKEVNFSNCWSQEKGKNRPVARIVNSAPEGSKHPPATPKTRGPKRSTLRAPLKKKEKRRGEAARSGFGAAARGQPKKNARVMILIIDKRRSREKSTP